MIGFTLRFLLYPCFIDMLVMPSAFDEMNCDLSSLYKDYHRYPRTCNEIELECFCRKGNF